MKYLNNKSLGSFFSVLMAAILLIACNDEENYDALLSTELSGTYSNKLSRPTGGDSLALNYNGNVCIGKEVIFTTDDGKTGDLVLKYILPHEQETVLENISLTTNGESYTFQGESTSSLGTRFHFQGNVQAKRLELNLSQIVIPNNQLTTNGTWYIAHKNASYYNVDNGSMQTMVGMLYNLVAGKLVSNLISSVLEQVSYLPDGNIQAQYAPLPDSVKIKNLMKTYLKRNPEDWRCSPANLATYYVKDDQYIYVIPQIDMIIRQVQLNKQTKSTDEPPAIESVILGAYQKITAWSTTGIKMSIRKSDNPSKGDLILVLEKEEIQELFSLLELVKAFIPKEKLEAPIMDLVGPMIPPQFAGIAGILLNGKTVEAILDQLSKELNSIQFETGIYFFKNKQID